MLDFVVQLFFSFATAMEYQKYLLLGAMALLALWKSPHRKHLLLALLVTGLLVFAAKDFYAQPRPCMTTPGLIDCPLENGFPSAHAAIVMPIALGVLGTAWFYLLGPLALLTAYSRIFLGVHTPGQVAAGLALGAFVYLIIMELEKRVGKRA